MARKVVLLTGVAGFIGSHAAERLLSRGDEVVGLDSFDDYYSPAQKRKNILACTRHPAFRLVEGDIRDDKLLNRLFSERRFSAVLHLAGLAGVRTSVEEPERYFDVNLSGTLKLLIAAQKHGRPNFVFASTSSAYGRTQKVPFVESDSADHPLAPYPASKRSAELLGHAFHHNHGLDFTALRFFTVYGPRNRPDMLPYLVMDSIHRGIPFPLYNGGEMFRDWTYVDDIVTGMVSAVDRRLGYEVINLGRGEPVKLREFVAHLERLAGTEANYHAAEMPASDVPRTFASIDKAKRLLDYKPRVSVEEGVANFFSWYQSEAHN